jgi:hypothetical protein
LVSFSFLLHQAKNRGVFFWFAVLVINISTTKVDIKIHLIKSNGKNFLFKIKEPG